MAIPRGNPDLGVEGLRALVRDQLFPPSLYDLLADLARSKRKPVYVLEPPPSGWAWDAWGPAAREAHYVGIDFGIEHRQRRRPTPDDKAVHRAIKRVEPDGPRWGYAQYVGDDHGNR